MFQDHSENFNIEYDNAEPLPNDTLLCYEHNMILCGIDKENKVILPKFKDFSEKPQCVFLFSQNETRYFLSLGGKVNCIYFKYKNLNILKSAVQDKNQFAAVTGYHYYAFHKENKFCGTCGGELVHDPQKRCMICQKCGNEIFPKISPAVIVGVIDRENDSILLTKYADREYKKYALVAGFAEMGESIEDAARREVMEETGLEIKNLKYFKSQPWGFAQNLLMGFFAEVKDSRKIVMDKTELSEALWVKKENLSAVPDSPSLTGEMMWRFKNS